MWCTNKSPSAEYHGDDDDGDVDGDGDDDDDGHVGDGDGDVAPGGDRQPINDRPVQWVKQKQGSCMIMMLITSGVMMITSGVITSGVMVMVLVMMIMIRHVDADDVGAATNDPITMMI